MERLRAVVALAVLLSLVGCAGVSNGPTPGAGTFGADRESPQVVEALDAADALYREALDHYVLNQRDEAITLLEQALAFTDGIDPVTDDGLSAVTSLESRVLYFLDALGEREYESTAATADERAGARVDNSLLRAARLRRQGRDVSAPISLVTNERVEKWLDYFQGKGRKEMQKWLGRSSRYRPMIEGILADEGLPSELFYLAVIESGLNPNAYSRARACGMWQFIASRARMYGLRVDWWLDERRDPEKATRAAAAYLKDLHQMFGCWELALAGYNSGEGRVARARKKRPSCEDFWCLDLPRETENFVPKFIAAALIGKDPKAYGFTVDAAQPPLAYDSIEVAEATDLQVIARGAAATAEEIRKLNPALRRWCTAPEGAPTVVRVPPGSGSRCLAALASIPAEERVTWRRHRISRGETLSGIARHYGTSVRAVLTVNDIKNPHRIRSGAYVIIPIGPADSPVAAGLGETFAYTVCRGDTITSIARRFGKRTRDVLEWNGLGWKSRIYPGDVITIHNM